MDEATERILRGMHFGWSGETIQELFVEIDRLRDEFQEAKLKMASKEAQLQRSQFDCLEYQREIYRLKTKLTALQEEKQNRPLVNDP